MTKSRTGLLILLAVAVLVLGFVALRAVPRWRFLRKMLNSPELVTMLSVTCDPKIQIVAPGSLTLAPIDIGYAGFALPSDLKIKMTSRGNGAVVGVESAPLSLLLFDPSDIDATALLDSLSKMENMGSVAKADWQLKHLLQVGDGKSPAKANIVDMQLLAVKAGPPSFMSLMLMSDAEFKVYALKLIMRGVLCPQAERIVPYEGTNSVGVIYIREGGTRGVIELTTHNRRISQTIAFEGANGKAAFPPPELSTFLASYRFTVESCPSPERTAEMIAASGIIPRVPPKQDSTEHDEREKSIQQYNADTIMNGLGPVPPPLTE